MLENESNQEYMNRLAYEISKDRNRLSKAIAAYIRNELEDFHSKYLSDEQMRELNPLIRNAVYTFIIDFNLALKDANSEENVETCFLYIISNTKSFICPIALNDNMTDEFYSSILNGLSKGLYDASKGCVCLMAMEYIYVPDCWEDCEYIKQLKQRIILQRNAKLK